MDGGQVEPLPAQGIVIHRPARPVGQEEILYPLALRQIQRQAEYLIPGIRRGVHHHDMDIVFLAGKSDLPAEIIRRPAGQALSQALRLGDAV